MDKKTLRIITILSTVVLMLCICSLSFAAEDPSKLQPKTSNTAQIDNVGQKIMGILQTLGIVVAVIVLMILGIKYMMGSAEEKAEYKKTMIPYVVGAVLIFGATTIANMVFQFANGLNNTAG